MIGLMLHRCVYLDPNKPKDDQEINLKRLLILLILLQIGFGPFKRSLKYHLQVFFHSYLAGKTTVVLKFEGAGVGDMYCFQIQYSKKACFPLGMDI